MRELQECRKVTLVSGHSPRAAGRVSPGQTSTGPGCKPPKVEHLCLNKTFLTPNGSELPAHQKLHFFSNSMYVKRTLSQPGLPPPPRPALPSSATGRPAVAEASSPLRRSFSVRLRTGASPGRGGGLNSRQSAERYARESTERTLTRSGHLDERAAEPRPLGCSSSAAAASFPLCSPAAGSPPHSLTSVSLNMAPRLVLPVCQKASASESPLRNRSREELRIDQPASRDR